MGMAKLNLKNFKGYLQFAIVIIVLFFFIRYVYKNWSLVSQFHWEFNYFWLFFSLFLVFTNFMIMLQIWRKLLALLERSLGFRKAFKIWFYSSLGKYVPGKLWSVLGMVYMCEREGISRTASLTSAILNQALNIIGGLFLVVLLSGTKFFGSVPRILYLPIILIFVFFLYPPVMEKALNFGLKWLKKEQIKFELSFGQTLLFTLFFMLTWVLYGLAFNLFIKSLTDCSLRLLPFLTSAFAFSYIVGFLSIFVPGGLGVREGVLILSLSTYFPVPVATLVALLSRLWMTAVELLGLTVSVSFGFFERGPKEQNSF
jgi:glycosyltransferase 2 family protein